MTCEEIVQKTDSAGTRGFTISGIKPRFITHIFWRHLPWLSSCNNLYELASMASDISSKIHDYIWHTSYYTEEKI